jgi:hypothetical protein
VFEVALRWLFRPREGWTPPADLASRIRRLFDRDGIEITDDGRFVIRNPAPTVVAHELLSNLTDSAVIHGHLERIAGAIERDDPEQAIGSAKELIESTAKLVLRETGTTFDPRADVPDLVKQATEALMVHPTSAGPDGSDAVRKILGGGVTIANRVAELRNSYGTGHGQAERRTGLRTRHARLAINAARLWCEFMLDTLSDPDAPWRQAGASGS